jgi:hypothetical protein
MRDSAPTKGKHAGLQLITVTYARPSLPHEIGSVQLGGEKQIKFMKQSADLLTDMEARP